MTSRPFTIPSTDSVTGYVNAGGRGTRLNPLFTPDAKTGVTKALLEVGSPPLVLVEHQVNKMLAAGVNNVVVGVGDHELVARHIEAKYGSIECVRAVYSEVQLGNGGDLLQAVQKFPYLFTENVAIANVDTILDWSVQDVHRAHLDLSAVCTIALTLNKGVPNEGAFFVDAANRVIYSAEASANSMTVETANNTASYRGSSTGSVILSTEFLKGLRWRPNDGSYSLYKDIVGGALATEGLYAYNNEQRFFIDVGTVTTWNLIQRRPEMLKPYLHY